MPSIDKYNEWSIIETNFDSKTERASESLFSIGNGKMGQRGNLEEYCSADRLKGNYIAGIYVPDKTKVGWWKIGYPEYYAKVVNAPTWAGLDLFIDNERVDLAACHVLKFRRELNMREGYLKRICTIEINDGKIIEIESIRFLSIADDRTGYMKYSVKPLNSSAQITISTGIDGDVKNEDSNFGEKFWFELNRSIDKGVGAISYRTQTPEFHLAVATAISFEKNGEIIDFEPDISEKNLCLEYKTVITCNAGDSITLYKYAAVLSSKFHDIENLLSEAIKLSKTIIGRGFNYALQKQNKAWREIWSATDLTITGDQSILQALRFNLFHLHQTYTGNNPDLNFGPKGFTGEKYGGSTYWDSEAFCLPYLIYLSNSNSAKNLLLYRYNQLDKAIENAEKLGFSGGAALYPMVTMNGEECHNEWEITFEEIHRNGAIAYAIYNYVNYTDDKLYLAKFGLKVLIAIARFWKQRVNWSECKKKFVILCVTGPNEYENSINNNWYTNFIASWCLTYTIEALNLVNKKYPDEFEKVIMETGLDYTGEVKRWNYIAKNIWYPVDEEKEIILQQEGFLDKEILPVSSINESDLPLNRNWSWDRILRSCFIKQADVLQGLYFFRNSFEKEVLKRNFEFYEPLTVHESSLSPSVHSIIASRIGKLNKAYELLVRSARLDLDDYNKEVSEGLHITSMAGSVLALIEGFAGISVINKILTIDPVIYEGWKSYSFKFQFRNRVIRVKISSSHLEIQLISGDSLQLSVYNKIYKVEDYLKIPILIFE